MANLKTFADAKDWVMLNTRENLALLASDLGYAWPMGTKGYFPGDNMLLDGDSWISDTSGEKQGPKPLERLVIKYGDWKIQIKDLTFDEAKISHLEPFIARSGNLVNKDPHPTTGTVKAQTKVTREVTHSNETAFSAGASVGASFKYEPPAGFGGSLAYTVSLEQGSTKEDTTGNTDVVTFTEDTKKTVKPYTAIRWNMMVSKVKATTFYKAKVRMTFSVEFQGYLRWGGDKGLYKNFHVDYSGKDDRPTFNYKFGSATKSFADDLKEKSSGDRRPWLWDEMKQRYTHSAETINVLCDASNYEFNVAGKIDDISGQRSTVRYKDMPLPGTDMEA